MTRSFLLLIALALALAGCAINHQDRSFLKNRGISGPLYDKMLHHEPLTVDDIVELTQKGVPGPFVVHYLLPTYFVYKLNPSEVDRLRKAGVDDGVIRYLLATPAMFSPSAAPPWYSEDPRMGGYYQSTPRY